MRIDAFNSVSKVYPSSTVYKTKSAAKTYGSDSLEISQAGRDYQVAKAAVSQAADVRENLVADIKARMAAGTYNVSDSEFADKIIADFTSEITF